MGERLRRARWGAEFRALGLAELVSTAGDQLAKVALSVLVYQRTGSAAWSGAAYALTLLPPLLTGPLLAGLADRFPRRAVMVGCCLTQAGFVLLMTPPWMPIWGITIAITLVTAASTPFRGAQGALVHDILGADRNTSGRARLSMVREIGQLLGLAGAAAVVGMLGTIDALVGDAVSFLIASVVVAIGLSARPVPARTHSRSAFAAGVRPLFATPTLRQLAALVLLLSLTAVPDGVITPLAQQAGAPVWTVGPLLAADCVGFIAGAHWLSIQLARRQRALIGPLAVLSVAPLALVGLRPGLVVLVILLVASGVGSAYLPAAGGQVTELVPDDTKGAVNGVLQAGLRAGQGIAVLVAGVLAQLAHSAAAAVAAAGTVGVVTTGWCALRWHRGLSSAPAGG